MPDTAPKAVNAALDYDMAELQKKKKSFEELSVQSQQVSKQVSNLGDEIKTLESRIAEVKKTSDAYIQVADTQVKAVGDNSKVIEQKRTMASAGVKDQQADIERTVKAVDADISSSKTKLDASRGVLDKANRDYDVALADSQKKQANLATLKQVQKDTDSQLKEVTDLIAQAAKAEAIADIVSMYFLIEEAAAKVEKITIMSVDEYAKKVSAAQTDVDDAKTTLGQKKSLVEQRTKELSGNQSEFDGKKATRQSTILNALKEMKPATPAPAKEPKSAPVPAVPPANAAAAAPGP